MTTELREVVAAAIPHVGSKTRCSYTDLPAADRVLAAIRKEVANDPGLLEELGLEQAGWQAEFGLVELTAGNAPEDAPVWRLRRDDD